MNTQDALKLIYRTTESFSQTALLDAQVILAHILNKTRAWVIAHPEAILNADQIAALEQFNTRLSAGEPLPYILGSWEFFGLEFTLTPEVLIPRPETELLVEEALSWLKAHPGRRHAIDVGTGSSCIAISLATHLADLHIIACDISESALWIAKKNTLRHRVEQRVHLVCADLLVGIQPPLNRPFDLICANLPYIPLPTLDDLRVSRWEPRLALGGGIDGLDLIRRLLNDIPDKLSPGGMLLMEIEYRQGHAVADLVSAAIQSADVRVLPDLAGHDRLVVCQI